MMVGCLVLQLVLSAARSCLTSRMEIALRNELHRKLFCAFDGELLVGKGAAAYRRYAESSGGGCADHN